ncbi:hypothetical protein RUND412_009501, partial [Rhizina undulata]
KFSARSEYEVNLRSIAMTPLTMFTAIIAVSTPMLTSARAIPDYLLPRDTSPRDLAARSPISDCLTAKCVPFILQNNPEWSLGIKAFNRRFTWVPAAIALPNTNEHVSDAVICAKEHNVKVAARCGGHSYAAYGLGGQDGSLMVDMVGFQGVDVDNETKIATVKGGMRLGNMALELFKQGERALPHGTCPGVGIGGHASFGGFGLDSRLWGMTLDQITELTAVLANGSIVTATENQHRDLFWALRGAGPSFAIITEFKLHTYPAPEHNFWWFYQYTFTPSTAAKAFLACQTFGAKAPKELGFGIVLNRNGSFRIRGMYYGLEAQYKPIIAPLLKTLQELNGGKPPVDMVEKDYEWLPSLVLLSDSTELNRTTKPFEYQEHDTFFVKSLVTPESQPLTKDALVNFFNYLQTHGENYTNDWFIIVNLYGGGDSLINVPPPSTSPNSTSSFAHRDSLFVFQFYANTPTHEPPFDYNMEPFLGEMVKSLIDKMPGAEFAGYANYVDPTLKVDTAHKLYYMGGYEKLKAIKEEVDKDMVFWFPQVIGRT